MKNRKKIFLVCFIIALNLLYGQDKVGEKEYKKNQEIEKEKEQNDLKGEEKLYKKMDLKSKISYDAFKIAVLGYNSIIKNDKKLLTIVDFTKPSNEERFFVLDLEKEEILYETYVAHGMKSGEMMAQNFSNVRSSNKSSPGFYLTENIYNGRNGYSMRLEGLEKGINDNAKDRAIVVHGAKYANPTKNGERLGRSFGCLALPTEVNQEIVDTIKNGSIIYVHTNNKDYVSKSQFATLARMI